MNAARSTESLPSALAGSRVIAAAIVVATACWLAPSDALCQSFDEGQNTFLLAQNKRRLAKMMSIDENSTTGDLIRALEEASFKGQRRYAAELLGARMATEAIPCLLKALKDPERVVQKDAAKALTKMGNEKLYVELIENLGDSRARVRQYSAYVLGELVKGADQREIPDIIEALEKLAGDEDKFVRGDVVDALSKIGASSSESVFIEGMKDDHHSVRMYSANALAKIKGDEAEEALADAYVKETHMETRLTIAAALGGFGTPRALSVLVETLYKEPISMRMDIASKLAESRTHEAAEVLAKLLVSDVNAGVRTTAARGLMTARDASTLPALAEALRDRVASVRIAASETLIELADESITEDLLSAMLDSNEQVAENAARALSRLHATDTIPGLIRMLDNNRESVVSRAADLLQDLTYRPYGTDVEMWKSWYEDNYKKDDQ